MKVRLVILAAAFLSLLCSPAAFAQDDSSAFSALGAKLEEYLTAIERDAPKIKCNEADFLIESCQDSLTRQFAALKIYSHYMNSGESSLKEDCRFFRHVFEEEFADSEEMSQILESMSIYWGEDLPYSLSYVCKTLDAMGKGIRWSLPPLYLSETRKGEDVEDDRLFARNLLRASYVNFGKYAGMVSESASNWDNDRMVSTDMCLIVMGMAEAVAFPTIPVKVTINEYVEISKYFGTPKSKIFVNGILDKVIQRLASEGKVVKSGKGLI